MVKGKGIANGIMVCNGNGNGNGGSGLGAMVVLV